MTSLRAYARPCTPPVWARGGHAQTILAHVLPTAAPALVAGRDGVERHEVPLPGGDRLCALYRPGTSGALVHLFHGLSGDANADYVRLAAEVARRLGHGVLAVNHRGCGDGAGLARGVYHSGRADDLGEVFAWSRRRFGARALAVGFSLSGNALLLLLARGGRALPDAAIAVNPPVDLARCSARISSGWNRVYDRRFVRRLSASLRRRRDAGLLPERYVLPRARTLRELDEEVTAPLGGFRDADDYYARCSTRDLLARIDTPTVIVSAADDPFVGAEDLVGAPRSAAVHLHLESSGGHVGYLARGAGLRVERWLEGALTHYLGELERAVEGAA
ncbi:MAG: alpha/beta fold hydrolase [Planctomycetes bacterium]|nr:alpha/beta fold hydrolase [Planctomycetota bacterium]